MSTLSSPCFLLPDRVRCDGGDNTKLVPTFPLEPEETALALGSSYKRNSIKRNSIKRNSYKRNSYEKSGYTRRSKTSSVYKRSGYKRSGDNRSVYKINSYNRHGCKKRGYKRRGYKQLTSIQHTLKLRANTLLTCFNSIQLLPFSFFTSSFTPSTSPSNTKLCNIVRPVTVVIYK